MSTILIDTKPAPAEFDFSIWGGGTVYMLTPQTATANDWVEANLKPNRLTLGDSIPVEPRYIQAISVAILNADLSIEMNGKRMIIDRDGDCALA